MIGFSKALRGLAQEWRSVAALSSDLPGRNHQLSAQVAALAQLMAGVPDYVVTETGNTDNGLRTTGLGAYVQDDIRVLPRFTLNVGLRWEFNSPPIEIHNRFSVPDLSLRILQPCPPYPDCAFIQAGTDGIPRATYGRNLHDFAPRIGFAWRPLKTERFVVRSAFGIFYDENILNLNILPRFNPPFVDISARQLDRKPVSFRTS